MEGLVQIFYSILVDERALLPEVAVSEAESC